MREQELDQELEELNGCVAAVIYQNEESSFSVLRVDLGDGSQATVVGCIPLPVVGESITAWGRWEHNGRHGEQFEAKYMERAMPTDANGIYNYLASRAIKGIGPATAAVLVGKFGSETLNVIRDEPDKVAAIKGIGAKKAAEISDSVKRQTGMRMLMEDLALAGLSAIFALRLYRCYGEDAREALQDNPYIIAAPQIGAKFQDADKLALRLGMEGDSPQRAQAAIEYMLRYSSGNGHCFVEINQLVKYSAKLIGVAEELVREALDLLQEEGRVVIEPVSNVTACYLTDFYEAEVYIARKLKEFAARKFDGGKVSVDLVIEKIEAEQQLTLAEMQRKTVCSAIENQLVLITGGPGTGKTTSVRAVLSLYDQLGIDVMLAAPTGQAAKRLGQVTGRDASTIHRMLEACFSPETDSVTFRKNEKDKLCCGALIVDECSMIDISLMRALLAALPKDCRLVLVGDADQLPSVGPGRVFRDVIESGITPAVRLTEIFRQQEGSMIVTAAHDINVGTIPDLRRNKDGFFFLRRRDPEEAAQTVISLCAERLPKNMGIQPQQIQILSPTRKGPCGTLELNKQLQAALNPPATEKPEFTAGDRIFRVGDRVMQIRNNYDLIWTADDMTQGYGVFNGDVGFISEIDTASDTLTVDFDGRRADYLFQQASELEHAWAATVHKAQGSEYRAVIIACNSVPKPLQYRALLYTGVTRAAELLIMVGEETVLQNMVHQRQMQKRFSGLLFRLRSND